MAVATSVTTARLRRLLAGGDRRSLAGAGEALRIVRQDAAGIPGLVALLADDDRLVVMRAADLLEKLAREKPARIEPYKRLFLGALADSEEWEIRLQVVRALPLFAWSETERARAIVILKRDVDHPRLFVRAWAADALARFAEVDPSLAAEVERVLQAFEGSGSKALRSRARAIRARLARQGA